MEIGLPHVAVWIIAGIQAGTVTGMIVKEDRRRFGVLRNLGLGMTGTLVGRHLVPRFPAFSEPR